MTWNERLAVFDLETTGVDVTTARIVTAFIGVLDADGVVLEQRSWMADPGIPIPGGASAIHGVTTERAKAEGRPAPVVVRELVSVLGSLQQRGIPVAAYNAAYDFTVLEHEAARHGVPSLGTPGPVIDPLILDKHVDRYRRGKRTLGVACEHYGVALDGWHDASADAVAAGRLALAMRELFPVLQVAADQLHASTTDWALEQATNFETWMRQRDPLFTAGRGWPVRDTAMPKAS